MVPPYHRLLLALRLSLEKLHDADLEFDEGKEILRLWVGGIEGCLRGDSAVGLAGSEAGSGTWMTWKDLDEICGVEVGGWK